MEEQTEKINGRAVSGSRRRTELEHGPGDITGILGCSRRKVSVETPSRHRTTFLEYTCSLSISTVTSDIPEIVVSADDCTNTGNHMRPHTPAISLIYDFGVASPDLEEQER